jgi:hypothetical protein
MLTSVDTTWTWSQLADGSKVASGSVLTGSTNYNAGNINYSTLGIDKPSFSDPAYSTTATGNYRLWVATTTNKGMLYQLAATLESNGDDAKQALVRGYFVTWSTNDVNWLIKGTASASWITNKSPSDFPY